MIESEGELISKELISRRERDQLEMACSAAAMIKGLQHFETAEIIKIGDPDKLSGLNLKGKHEEIATEINHLQRVLKGDFEREVSQGDSVVTLTEDYVEEMKKKVRENEAALKNGVEILQKLKAVYDRKLALLKMKKFRTHKIPKYIKALHGQMDEVLRSIIEQTENCYKKVECYQAEMNKLSNEFAQNNIDSLVSLPTFVEDKRIRRLRDFVNPQR